MGHPLDRQAGPQFRADHASLEVQGLLIQRQRVGRVVQRCGLWATPGSTDLGRWDHGGPQVVTHSPSLSLGLPRQCHLCCLGGIRLGPRVPPGSQSAPGPLLALEPAWPTLCLGGCPQPTPGVDPG